MASAYGPVRGCGARPRTSGQLAPDIVYLITLPFLGPKAALAERDKTRAEIESAVSG
jgi:hypothetical protein